MQTPTLRRGVTGPVSTGVSAIKSKTRSWNGASVTLNELRCSGKAFMDVSHAPTSQPTSRLAVVLSQGGGRCEHRPKADRRPDKAHPGPSYASILPSGMEIWGYSEGIRHVRGMSLDFDVTKLAERFEDDIDEAPLLQPRLMFEDARVMRLCELFAAEIEEDEPTNPLYGDSLVLAVFHDVLRSKGFANDESGIRPLPLRLLRRATEYMRENLANRIELGEARGAHGPLAVALQPQLQGRDGAAALPLAPERADRARATPAARDGGHPRAGRAGHGLRRSSPHDTRVSQGDRYDPSQWKRATK